MNSETLSQLALLWTRYVSHMAWQAAVVGLLALLVIRYAKRLSPQVRYAILIVALAKFIVPPFWNAPTGAFGLMSVQSDASRAASPTFPADSASSFRVESLARDQSELNGTWQAVGNEQTFDTAPPFGSVQPFDNVRANEPVGDQQTSAREILAEVFATGLAENQGTKAASENQLAKKAAASRGTDAPGSHRFRRLIASIIVCVHLTGMILITANILIRYTRLRIRLRQMPRNPERWMALYQRCAAQMDLKRLPTLRVDPDCHGPYSCGWIFPSIVVPTNCLDQLTESEVGVVFAHELGHHRRGDLFVATLQIVVFILWWFHPVVWILSRTLRSVREDCCDDALLARQITSQESYCDTLMKVARLCHSNVSSPALSIAMAASPLARRFQRIMDETIRRFDHMTWPATIGVVLVAAMVLPGLTQSRPSVDSNQISVNAPTAVQPAQQVSEPSKTEAPVTPWPTKTEVIVKDPAGNPVADALVQLRYNSLAIADTEHRTNAEGRVKLTLPNERPRYMSVRIRTKQYVMVGRSWYAQRSPNKVPPPQVEFQLEEGSTVGGSVLDFNGDPIADAEVNVHVGGDKPGPGYYPSPYIARTDAIGRWVVKNVPKNTSTFQLQIKHDDFTSDANQFSRRFEKPDERATLRQQSYVAKLVKGQLLSGTITDDQGNAVVGARVFMGNSFTSDHADQPTTDQQGRYEFRHCQPGEKEILVYHADYAPAIAIVSVGKEPVRNDIVLNQGSIVRLKVVDSRNRSLPGLTVSTDTWKGNRVLAFPRQLGFENTKTDKDGMWVWTHAPVDPIRYRVYGTPWVNTEIEISPSKEIQTITMKPEFRITGRVLDSVGNPIPTFKVVTGTYDESRQNNPRGPYYWNRWNVKTYKDGEFDLAIDEEVTTAHALMIEAKGYRPFRSRPLKPAMRKANLDVRLATMDALAGTVLEPDGTPAADAKIIVGTRADRPYIRAEGESNREAEEVKTNASGQFEISDPNIEFSLFVFSKQGFAVVNKAQFDDAKGEPLAIKTLAYSRVKGRLAVKPKPGEKVRLTLKFQGEMGGQSVFGENAFFDIGATADEHGHFVFNSLPPMGDIQIYRNVELKNGQMTIVGSGAMAMLTLQAGQEHDIMIGTPGQRVVGRVEPDDTVAGEYEFALGVVNLAGRPRSKFESGKNVAASSFLISPDGSFAIDGLPPGKHSLDIRIREPSPRNGFNPNQKVIASISQRLLIPDPVNPMAQPIDLGVLKVHSGQNQPLPEPKAAALLGDLPKAIEMKPAKIKPAVKKLAKPGAGAFTPRPRVVDAAGNGIQATLKVRFGSENGIQTPEYQSDANGKASMDPMPSHGGWVVAFADGYRTRGVYIDAETVNPTIEMTAVTDDVDAKPLANWAQPANNLRVRADDLMISLANQVFDGTDEYLKFRVMRLLSPHPQNRIDEILRLHENHPIDFSGFTTDKNFESWHDGFFRVFLAGTLARKNPNRATEILETIKTLPERITGYTNCTEKRLELLGAKQDPQMVTWLDEAWKITSTLTEPTIRMERGALVARRWLDLGNKPRARKVLDVLVKDAGKPSKHDRNFYARSLLAWELARVDAEATMKLFAKDIDQIKPAKEPQPDSEEYERMRFAGNLAHRLATERPDLAEELLAKMSHYFRESYGVRVCYAMSEKDAARAIKLAKSFSHLRRGQALGVIADRLADSDKPRAEKLMRVAFESLARTTDEPSDSRLTVGVACSLLPTVKKIDPSLVDEYVWWTLAMPRDQECHSGCNGPVRKLGADYTTKTLRIADGLLGATLAKFNAEVGQKVAYAPGDQSMDLPFTDAPYFLFGMAMLTSPEQAIGAIEKLPQDNTTQQRIKLRAMMQAYPMMDNSNDTRWNWLMDEEYQIWRIGKFDL